MQDATKFHVLSIMRVDSFVNPIGLHKRAYQCDPDEKELQPYNEVPTFFPPKIPEKGSESSPRGLNNKAGSSIADQ